jgi:S-DNA-T family DNA segregation ATPase FtsK/SpoIIIE
MVRKKRKNKQRKKSNLNSPLLFLPRKTKKIIVVAAVFFTAIIVELSFFGKAGIVGEKFDKIVHLFIGETIYVLPLFLVGIGILFLGRNYRKFLGALILACFILILGISGTLACFYPQLKRGGWLGYIFSSFLAGLFGPLVAKIVFFTLILIGFLIFWQLLFLPLLKERKMKEEKKEETKETVLDRVIKQVKKLPSFKIKKIPPLITEEIYKSPPKPSLELKKEQVSRKPLVSEYKIPPLDLLEKEKEKPSAGDVKTNSAIIQKTLENFDIPVQMAGINIGPTVTQYTLKPSEGIKLSRITTLSNNLALALAAHPIRTEAPIPGKSLVGIEVPNKIRAKVRLKSLVSKPTFQNSASNLIFALGKDVSGQPVYADLSEMPHLLVAGATGTGKTIFLNNLILSFLYQNSPQSLRLILIDPKRVEFTAYNKLPHLLCSVIYDAPQTVNCLNWLISEMGRRFDLLSLEKVRDITSYNDKVLKEEERENEFIPYIILIIDELADLIIAKGKEIETGIVRLAQLARAVGIHLVVATQRPSVEVITGLIKANITSRISFQVASQIDSRTILDMAGAERLLGLGDMLYLSARTIKPKRIQGAYVAEGEFKRVVQWIAEKNKEAFPEDGLAQSLKEALIEVKDDTSKLSERAQKDVLYNEAKKVVIEEGRASASLLQRKLRVGYARAARLIDILEERGIVGPPRGAKPRKVFIEEDDFGNDYDEDID